MSGTSSDAIIDTQPLPQSATGLLEASAQQLILLVYHRNGADAVVLEPQRPLVLGRESPADRIVRDSSVSRQHARFTLHDGVVEVEDLRSKNGTWKQGRRVERCELRVGEDLCLGSVLVAVYARGLPELEGLGLVSHEELLSTLELEIRRAKHFGRNLSLVMVRTLRDDDHINRWSMQVREKVRPIDRLGMFSSSVLEILLPELGASEAREFASAIAMPSRVPSLIASVATFPQTGATADRLIEVCLNGLRQAGVRERVVVAADEAFLASAAAKTGESVVQSDAMRVLYEQVERIAPSAIPVLVTGETGSGKEVVARALHERSRRKGQLVSINCGAIPANLVESTLFGHERGAFTGADSQRKGAFEQAHGGTLFLDEIGELPLAVQATLLRVLETKKVMRVGSTREIETSARVIAATHRDLEAMACEGEFRADLMYRLNVISLSIPPLRTRPEEIRPLSSLFLARANDANARTVRGIAPEALVSLEAYHWPGNVRELRNAIERAVVIARGDWILPEDLPERVRGVAPAAQKVPPPAGSHQLTATEIKARVQQYEAELIQDALAAAGGNQTEAAKQLGMPLRTLVRRVRSLRGAKSES